MMEELINVVEYLKDKGISFAVKTDYKYNKPFSVSIFGVTITKKGKFYRANGVIIAGNMAQYFLKIII